MVQVATLSVMREQFGASSNRASESGRARERGAPAQREC